MDLSGQSKVVTIWDYVEETDTLTITFKNHNESSILGNIIIEGARARSLLDALTQVAPHFLPRELDLTTRKEHITQFDSLTNKAITEWV